MARGVRAFGRDRRLFLTGYACTTLAQEDLPQATAIINSFRQIIETISASIIISVMAMASSSPLGIAVQDFSLSFVVRTVVVAVGVGAGFVLLPRTRRSK